ncbi:GNAT family N-acetyltransferase [Parachitinimonas caeni]|uniref:GNAT family N-acetyltransferase n=1 Tax=Parachitinimonas caeni TaxID=3031301 RepID=A0ABT7DYM4_9NEIS|nr:GNAT family N-acetyltransferase [Parachitinimonas caeni]MDK2125164.1 GNAT family N-acetyltransferase [Parachitinimonas caeni]
MKPAAAPVVIRDFQEGDAEGVSALFSAVYGEHYVYPDVYLPSMIRHHNIEQLWRTAVATLEGRIVGHAILWQDPAGPDSAELAMIVAHPSTRGMGIATRLGEHLCLYARQQGLATLTIKMVSSHSQTQRLARTLGFQTTGLLLDYVASPFGNDGRESVVIGVMPLQDRPIPQCHTGRETASWIKPLVERFGSSPLSSGDRQLDRPMLISAHGKRVDVTLEHASAESVEEITRLPRNRLIHLRIRFDAALPPLLAALHRAGYADTGLAPAPDGQWYWLLQRGYAMRDLEFHCPIARALYEGTQDIAQSSAA